MDMATNPRKAVIYTRVSTGKQAESGLSLTDQIEQATAAIDAREWDLVEHCADEGVSASKATRRPGLDRALALLADGTADVLVVAKQDRLARRLVSLGQIMATADKQGWDLVILDRQVDTSTPAGRLMLNIMGSVAQFEAELIGERAAMTHRQRKAQGKRAGQAPILSDEVRRRVAALRAEGETLGAIAAQLNAEGIPTARGGKWHPSTVSHVCKSVALDAQLAAVV